IIPVLLTIIGTCNLLHAQATALGSFIIQQHYTKREVWIPMRDGVQLFKTVYIPKDTTNTSPILFMRTPYSVAPYGKNRNKVPLGPNMHFTREGFIFVYQDIRGKYLSEGDFVAVRPYIKEKRNEHDVDESSDAYDTIDWLLKNIKGHIG